MYGNWALNPINYLLLPDIMKNKVIIKRETIFCLLESPRRNCNKFSRWKYVSDTIVCNTFALFQGIGTCVN